MSILLVYIINLLKPSGVNHSPSNNFTSFVLFWLIMVQALCLSFLQSLQNSHLLSLPHLIHCMIYSLYGKFSHGIPSLSPSSPLCHIKYNTSAFHLAFILLHEASLLLHKKRFRLIDKAKILANNMFSSLAMDLVFLIKLSVFG